MNSLHELGYIYSPYLSTPSINNTIYLNTEINMSSDFNMYTGISICHLLFTPINQMHRSNNHYDDSVVHAIS